MKYAIIDGSVKHISKVNKGTIAREFGTGNSLVVACKGKQRQYFKYIDAYTNRLQII